MTIIFKEIRNNTLVFLVNDEERIVEANNEAMQAFLAEFKQANIIFQKAEKIYNINNVEKFIFAIFQDVLRHKHLNHIPLALPPKVIGRKNDLEKVEELLFQDNALVIVNGIGGIGKTVLSHYYWQERQHYYTHLLWLKGDGNLEDALLYDYDLHEGLGIAEEMKYHLEAIRQPQNQEAKKQAIAFLYKSIKNVTPKGLMLIDNATDENRWIIKQWKTTFTNFHILVTSRETFDDVATYKLGYLPELEAIELFYLYYDRENELPHDDAIVAEIAQKAGYHTLTIELLAKTLRDSDDLTLATLSEKLGAHIVYIRSKKKTLIDANYTQSRNYIDYIIEFAFDLSRLKKKEYALHLLTQISVLPSYNLRAEHLKEMLVSEGEDENEYAENMRILWKSGWLERYKDESQYFYNCHAVIQEIIYKKQSVSMENCREVVQNITTIIYKCTQHSTIKAENWLIYANSILRKITQKHLLLAALANNTALVYREIGVYGVALKYDNQALSIIKKLLSDNNIDIITNYTNIAITYKHLGNYKKALYYDKKALVIAEKEPATSADTLAIVYNNIGETYKYLGNYKKALIYECKDLAICSQISPQNIRHIAITYNNIAITYQKLRDDEKALAYGLKSIDLLENISSENPIDLAKSYNNVAISYQHLENNAEALKYMLKDLAISETLYLADNPALAVSYNNIASVYSKLQDNEKALYYDEKSLAIRIKTLPENHADIAQSYNNLSLTLLAFEEYDKALDYALKANKILVNLYTKKHIDVAISYANIGLIYEEMGNYEMSLTYSLQNVAISEKVFTKNDPRLATIYHNISITYYYFEMWKDALMYEQKALNIRLIILPSESIEIRNSVETMNTFLYYAISAEGQAKYQAELDWFLQNCSRYLE